MRIAIVHDYLAQHGGAERVVEAMHELWPEAPIYTSVYDPEAMPSEYRQMDIRTSFLQNLPFAPTNRHHKKFLPFYPMAFEKLDLREFDVVVSSASTFAKGIITGPETCHLCFCHNPSRFAWRYQEYIEDGKFSRLERRLIIPFIHHLRTWDYVAAQRVDYFLANSYNVARRILKYYGRSSDILYPPVDTKRFVVSPNPKADYYLIVGRLIPYKRIDLAVQACTQLGLPLKVVGAGPDQERLKQMAGPTIEFLGRRSDEEVTELLTHCKAFFFPGEEDFGIAPVEAMASGRPVIALRAGGAMETVIDGKTGVFFDTPSVDRVIDAIKRLDTLTLDSQQIRAHAELFDTAAFHQRLQILVHKRYEEHQDRYNCIAPKESLLDYSNK
jgi:glycosyltransferase involved in cell wall biosynthesis